MKKSNVFKAVVAFALMSAVAFGVDTKGKLNGNDKNPSSRRDQAAQKVDKFKSKDANVTYQYTVGDDNINLLCTGVSSFGNELGWSHFEVDGDRADWTNWKDQIDFLNEQFSFYFSDYDLPDYLGGIYVYNMYGTQYIWNGGEICNPYDGWRNDCNNTTFFVARTLAQALFQDRADRTNFAFWVDYAHYDREQVAKLFADASLHVEWSSIHWRTTCKEVNGVESSYAMYANYKASLNTWYNIVCLKTDNGLVPVYVEHVYAFGDKANRIGEYAFGALDRYIEAMEAYSAESVVPDEVIPENFNGDPEDDLVDPRSRNDEDQTKESHDA